MSEPFDPSAFVTLSPDVANLNGAALLKLAAALQDLERWCVAQACSRTADEFMRTEDALTPLQNLDRFVEARCEALPITWRAVVLGEGIVPFVAVSIEAAT